MAALEQLQQRMSAHLLGADGGFGSGTAGAIEEAVLPGGIGAERRLAIYRHAYRMRLVDTLRDSYGHTLGHLGDEAFNEVARDYVLAHPSSHASLRWYGDAFPAWLARRGRQTGDADDGADLGPIGELAALDWALRLAFDGPDAPVLTLADLAALPPQAWADVGFQLHPTAARLQLRHNTLALWQALDNDQVPPASAPLPGNGALLIWRRGHQPHFRSLQPLEAAALDCLQAGLSFASTCDHLSTHFASQQTAADAGALLRRWIDEELLNAVRTAA